MDNKSSDTIERSKKIDIFVSKIDINEIGSNLNITWVNPRITNFDYPFDGSYLGNWEAEVLKLKKKDEI